MAMEQRTYGTEGIIIGRRNFGEADRVLTIFTKHHGKIRVTARGIRRTTSRKRGSLELFSYVRVFIARGKALDVLAEVEMKESFGEWRKDLTRVGVAYHLAEVVDRLTAENQENEEIFDLLVDAYQNLSMLDYWALHPYIQSFKVRLLEELGFLERGKPIPKNMDTYIEDLINSKLKTKKFLGQLKS
jgi:DNA repair protein RecO (recombination protein O)